MDFFSVKDAVELLEKVAAWHARARRREQRELDAIARSFGRFEEISKWYIEPDCQTLNPVNHDPAELQDFVRIVPRCSVLKSLGEFFQLTPRHDPDGQDHLFLLADAGMGKTSLLIELKLSELSKLWPGSHRCHLLKLGKTTLDEVASIENPQDTHLLLDSLDEDPCAFGRAKERTLELLDATKKFRKVIITCRTQFFEADLEKPGEVTIGPFRCPMLYLSPFSDRQVGEYLLKRLPPSFWDRVTMRNHRDLPRAQAAAQFMGNLRARPMLLSYIDDIMAGSQECEVQNEYALYSIVVDRWLRREEQKARERGHWGTTADALLSGAMILAVEAQEEGARDLPEERVRKLSEELSEVRAVSHVGLESRSLLNRTGSGSYRFAHYSFQEYLVARAFCFHRDAFLRRPKFVWTDLLKVFVIQARKLYDKANISRADLRQASLGCMDISNTDLSGLDLSNASLRGTNLTGTNLSGTNLIGADLRGARANGANLSGANLGSADLRGADLSHANVCNANLQRADLSGATFANAGMADAMLSNSKLVKASLNGANLSGANLIEADATDADLTGTNLRRGALMRAIITGARAGYANFSEADLSYAQLAGAHLIGAKFVEASLREANLTRASLSGANLSRADLSRAALDGANLGSTGSGSLKHGGAVLTNADLTKASLTSAVLSHAALAGASLRAADLRRANLRGTSLVQADLSGADLTDADLSSAALGGATVTGANFARATVPRELAKLLDPG